MVGNKLSPFKMWCQKVLPLVYDDSLSYYEVLCKLTHKINELIDAWNNFSPYNAVKFGGEWEEEKEYAEYCIVIASGNTYMSAKEVPVGTPLTDSEYWSMLFDATTLSAVSNGLNELKTEVDSHMVNITEFGAKCDGTTDDTEALRLAVASCKYVIINGNTVMNGNVNASDCRIVSRGNVVKTSDGLTITGNNNDLSINIEYENTVGLEVRGNGNKLHNCAIYRSEKVDTSTVYYAHSCVYSVGNNNVISDCELYNGQTGIRSDGVNNTYCNNTIHDTYTGMIIGGSAVGTKICHNVIKDIDVHYSDGADGILILRPAKNITIEGNIIENCIEHGMYVQSSETIVKNNFVSGCGYNGIKLASYEDIESGFYNENSVVSDNILVNNTGNDIYLQNTCIGTIVSDNECMSTLETSIKGVDVINADYVLNRDTIVHDNNCANGIYLVGNGTMQILNNKCKSVEVNSRSGSDVAMCIIKGNIVTEGIATNRVAEGICEGNTCTNLILLGTSGGWSCINNVVILTTDFDYSRCKNVNGNKFYLTACSLKPSVHISGVKEICNNVLICSGETSSDAWLKDAYNDSSRGVIVCGNHVTGCGSKRAIDFYSNYSICALNVVDSSAGTPIYIRGANSVNVNNVVLPA